MSRHDPKANCPLPHKKRHPSVWQAENEMRRVYRGRRRGGPLPVRVYLCVCGGYHTTSLTIEQHAEYEARRQQPPRGA